MISKRWPATVLALGLAVLGTAACGDDKSAGAKSSAATPTATPTASPTPESNGVENMSGDEAFAAARKAYKAASSVHIKGTVVEDGERMSLELRQSRSGDASATIGVDGAKAKILIIGKNVYVSGDRKFFQQAAGLDANTAKLLKGKWFKTRRTSERVKDLLGEMNYRNLADDLPDTAASSKRGEPKTVRGIPTIRFTDDEGSHYYIAAQGPPYPIKLSGTEDGERATLDFLEYGKPLKLKPPPSDDVITLPADPSV